MCGLYCNALDRNKYGSNPLVAINTEQLPSALKVLARALEQEFGECRYLYYGIGEPSSPLSAGSEGQSLLEMQQHFSDRLWQEIAEVVQKSKTTSKVDGISVPMPHFGCVLDWNSFYDLADKVQSAGIKFIVEPYIRFKDSPGEQVTMFFEDYSGNAIEFKAYRNPSEVFSK